MAEDCIFVCCRYYDSEEKGNCPLPECAVDEHELMIYHERDDCFEVVETD